MAAGAGADKQDNICFMPAHTLPYAYVFRWTIRYIFSKNKMSPTTSEEFGRGLTISPNNLFSS